MKTVESVQSAEGAPEIVFEVVTDEAESRRLFEARCRELLGISAEEFLAAHDAGTIWDSPHGEAVTELAMLVPFAR
jgi:hypothetical protein